MTEEQVDVLILGSGPAGFTAAIYASRAGLKPILYQGNQPGGQLTITSEVENFPGYPEGVQGPEMMEDLKKQAERFGADIRWGIGTKVDFSKEFAHEVIIDDKHKIIAKSVILATGASAKWLGLESESRLNGLGVSACAVCDGFFFKNKEVAIVGGGDTACEEAFYLSNLCSKVTMLVRKEELKASKILQQRVMERENIEILYNSQTLEVLGENEVEGVRILNNKTKEESVLNVSGFFVAIGHSPNTEVVKNYIELDDFGYIVVEKGSTNTSVKGVFACGDVQDKIYKQAITAAGTGCMAALDAERYLGLMGKI